MINVFLQYTFPFEGNWNKKKDNYSDQKVDLQYTFPFEGNWNSLSLSHPSFQSHLQYTFPFEGNWNRQHCPIRIQRIQACNTLSRLKGIETLCWLVWSRRAAICLAIHFPVWRELKLKDDIQRCVNPIGSLLYTFPFEGNWNLLYVPVSANVLRTCNTLSRLKGIETLCKPFPLLPL